jgi:site-specific recombinase XerC
MPDALARLTDIIIDTGVLGPITVRAAAEREAEIRDLATQAALYITRAKGPGTLRAYRSAWKQYCAWCSDLAIEPLNGDAATIGLYLVRQADRLAVATLRVHLAAIATAHRLGGLPLDLKHPRIAMVLEGVARTKGRRPMRQAIAILPETLRRMLDAQPDTPLGLRNRAMLLIGYGAALRRSELVALDVGDVVEVPQRGLKLLVRRSKTDQRGDGEEIAIWSATDPAFCPVHAWQDWLAVRAATKAEAPLFCGILKNGRVTGKRLSDKAVERLVGAAAQAIRLPRPERYTGHSLRAGLATAAGEEDAQLHDIMRQTRHRSVETARKYLRSRDLWRNNVTERIFRR